MTSKLHGGWDSKGHPLRLHLSEGEWSQFTEADALLREWPAGRALLAAKGDGSNTIRKMMSEQDISACIPSRRHRSRAVHGNEAVGNGPHNRDSVLQSEGAAHCSRPGGCAHIVGSAIFLALDVESVGCVTGIRPDKVLEEEVTILNVRHGQEGHGLGRKPFETIKEEAASSLCKTLSSSLGARITSRKEMIE